MITIVLAGINFYLTLFPHLLDNISSNNLFSAFITVFSSGGVKEKGASKMDLEIASTLSQDDCRDSFGRYYSWLLRRRLSSIQCICSYQKDLSNSLKYWRMNLVRFFLQQIVVAILFYNFKNHVADISAFKVYRKQCAFTPSYPACCTKGLI